MRGGLYLLAAALDGRVSEDRAFDLRDGPQQDDDAAQAENDVLKRVRRCRICAPDWKGSSADRACSMRVVCN